MRLDFRFLNKIDGSKVLQIRSGGYQRLKSKNCWKPWEIELEFVWSEWQTIREEVEEEKVQNEDY